MTSMIVNSGITRKIEAYTHKSSFIDDIKKINEANNIYLKDKQLLENIKKEGLLLAWFDILAEHCNKCLTELVRK
jgi:hypothetical protein